MLKMDFTYTMFIISLAIFIIWPVLAFFYFSIWPFVVIFNFTTWYILELSNSFLIAIITIILCSLLVLPFYELFKGFALAELHHH